MFREKMKDNRFTSQRQQKILPTACLMACQSQWRKPAIKYTVTCAGYGEPGSQLEGTGSSPGQRRLPPHLPMCSPAVSARSTPWEVASQCASEGKVSRVKTCSSAVTMKEDTRAKAKGQRTAGIRPILLSPLDFS